MEPLTQTYGGSVIDTFAVRATGNAKNPILSFFIMAEGEILISIDVDVPATCDKPLICMREATQPPCMWRTAKASLSHGNSLFQMAAIFDNSGWLPFMRSNMALLIPCHLYSNLKFSDISEFSEVRLPAATQESIPVYVNHIHVYAHCWFTCMCTVPTTFQKSLYFNMYVNSRVCVLSATCQKK